MARRSASRSVAATAAVAVVAPFHRLPKWSCASLNYEGDRSEVTLNQLCNHGLPSNQTISHLNCNPIRRRQTNLRPRPGQYLGHRLSLCQPIPLPRIHCDRLGDPLGMPHFHQVRELARDEGELCIVFYPLLLLLEDSFALSRLKTTIESR